MKFKFTREVIDDLELLIVDEFMAKYGVSRSATRCARYRYMIKSNRKTLAKNVFFAEDIAKMMEMRAAGLSYLKVGQHFNMGSSQARYVIKLAEANGFDSYPPRPIIHKGEVQYD